ncbi:hypothetical protein NC653_025070 [Populus alba x Populus x berolinensis]|uniref:Uncharacterized protein n=1 Tax=Populus alba x Populus x berolinensis TaxID=444605 RepID=A0AAD6MAC6_9ROSI|nr:hypothetical protein NC653_025070 [Populus alba x Populus x berolinensis]
MDSLAKNGSTVFVDALMTCCPDEKELLLSWKGIIVLIFCAKFRIGSYSDTWPSVAVVICFTIFVLLHGVVVAGKGKGCNASMVNLLPQET